MRTLAVIISMVVTVAIAVTTSVWFGILIALCCVVYQVMLSHTRSSMGPATKTRVWLAFLHDTVRSGVFLIPLVGALLNGLWFVAVATVVVFMVNLMMS